MTTEKLSTILWTIYNIIELILRFGAMVDAIDNGTYVAEADEEADA